MVICKSLLCVRADLDVIGIERLGRQVRKSPICLDVTVGEALLCIKEVKILSDGESWSSGLGRTIRDVGRSVYRFGIWMDRNVRWVTTMLGVNRNHPIAVSPGELSATDRWGVSPEGWHYSPLEGCRHCTVEVRLGGARFAVRCVRPVRQSWQQ